MLKEAIARLLERQDLERAEIVGAFEEIFSGQTTSAQIAGFLVALRMKGETSVEIAGAADAMRRNVTRVRVPEGRTVLDTCGTGGDGSHTFNISTAAAFVAAAAGATVAKHGGRSVSSSCGSADVLSAAGVNIQAPVAVVERCLREVGIGFLFAPNLHGVMKHVVAPRRELGIRSIFNLMGPLANPAGATHQLLGVYAPDLVPVVAQTLVVLGTERALVVHGQGGLDEISPCGPTRAALVENGAIRELEIQPEEVGVPLTRLSALRGGDPAANAEQLRSLLSGADGPIREAVVLNSAGALWVSGIAADLREGAQIAREVLDSGKGLIKLRQLIAVTTEQAEAR
jgi:anthranilate phosphoribosyltransferase